ncbi:hypothetical protein D3C75_1095470 [compost metagenome]
MAKQERAATQGIGEGGAPGLVIHFSRILGVAIVVIEAVARVAVLAIGTAVEITKISLERLVGGDRVNVHQAEEVLLVVVFQVRVVVLQQQVLGDLPVSTGVAELVAVLSTASHGQAGGV